MDVVGNAGLKHLDLQQVVFEGLKGFIRYRAEQFGEDLEKAKLK
jgi:hypothetical protein